MIIASGCSFCNWHWVESLGITLNDQWTNFQNSGCGNILVNYVITKEVSNLINSGKNPHEIIAIVMLSDPNRMDLMITKESTIGYVDIIKSGIEDSTARIRILDDKGNIIDLMGHDKKEWNNIIENSSTTFCSMGGVHPLYNNSGWGIKTPYYNFVDNWLKYGYTEEYMMINTLKEILATQSYFKSVGVEYYFTVWQNIFHWYDYKNLQPERQCMDLDINFKTRGEQLAVDVYPSLRTLWESIDFEKFIFYENSEVEMGGIAEFSISNDLQLGNESGDRNHPQQEGSELFGKFLAKNIINGRNK
jgi:hypothetical protein